MIEVHKEIVEKKTKRPRHRKNHKQVLKDKKAAALEAKLQTKTLISEVQAEKRQRESGFEDIEVLKKLGSNAHMDEALRALKRRRR